MIPVRAGSGAPPAVIGGDSSLAGDLQMGTDVAPRAKEIEASLRRLDSRRA
jgi:hypothetical protein